MKKILSLLSVLIISGTAVPTTIVASPYQKEKQVKLENIGKIQKQNNNENNKINKIKIAIKTEGEIFSSGVVLNKKLYFGSRDNNVYEYDIATGKQKIAFTTNDKIESSGIVLNNKLYFGSNDHNVYEYDPATEKKKIVIKTNNSITYSSGIVLNNKLYFGSNDHNVYEYDPVTGKQKIILTAKNIVDSSGVILNNKLYFGSHDHNVYEYNPNYYNLEQINDNFDNLILNELNYLNPELNISQLEVITKTNNSAIVKEKNKLNNSIKLEIHYSINNEQNKIINLNELIKRALFFKYRDENPNSKFKEINYINTNNLNFDNIEVTRNKKLDWGVDFKDVCFTKKNHINRSSIKKTYNIPKCEYNQKAKLFFQIIKGISKGDQDNTKNNWILNMDDENKLWDFVNPNYRDQIINHNLSNEFDFANLKQQEQEMIFVFNESEDKFELIPNEKATIAYSVKEIKYEATLNLKQKISGTISAQIIDNNNEEQIITLSIKEAMQILQKYNLLPNEININENNSITFNGKAIFSRISENKPELVLNTSII